MRQVLIILTYLVCLNGLSSQEYTWMAGEPLNIRLQNTTSSIMWVEGSFGTTYIHSNSDNEWNIPSIILNHQGIYDWYIDDKNQGTLTILATDNPTDINQYYGPVKIISDDNETAEVLSILTDEHGNIMPSPELSTTIIQNGKSKSLVGNSTEDFYTVTVNSGNTSGKNIVSTSHNTIATSEKEISVIVRALREFSIGETRTTDYADGHQIMELYSSPITYQDGSLVSDGTLVEFLIETKEKNNLVTYGLTVNGVAHAYMLHPLNPSQWTIKAIVAGYKESKPISVEFTPYIQPFDYSWVNHDALQIGPVLGAQGQLVHDGTPVRIYNSEMKELYQKQLDDGLVIIDKRSMIGMDTIIVEIGSHQKQIDIKK